MVVKVTMKSGDVKYYAGKDKDGRIILSDRTYAKEYSPRAKGTLNAVIYQIKAAYSAACEYEN